MKLFRIRSGDDYKKHLYKIEQINREHLIYLNSVKPKDRVPFTVPGFSYTAGRFVDFQVDYQHAGSDGDIVWRERVCCPDTFFNNRMRATFHLFDIEMNPYHDLDIYIAEQVTPIYKYFANHFDRVVGSEFLGSNLPLGSIDHNGVRNEDLCQLTFPDETFDRVVSLDVFEHIPDYPRAFQECCRVLKKGGIMMWSVPFNSKNQRNEIRATVVNNEVQHILPPEYHGDPLSSTGVLCFQHFGWEMLNQAKDAGFRDAYAISYQSIEFGYLGGEQFMFFAVK